MSQEYEIGEDEKEYEIYIPEKVNCRKNRIQYHYECDFIRDWNRKLNNQKLKKMSTSKLRNLKNELRTEWNHASRCVNLRLIHKHRCISEDKWDENHEFEIDNAKDKRVQIERLINRINNVINEREEKDNSVSENIENIRTPIQSDNELYEAYDEDEEYKKAELKFDQDYQRKLNEEKEYERKIEEESKEYDDMLVLLREQYIFFLDSIKNKYRSYGIDLNISNNGMRYDATFVAYQILLAMLVNAYVDDMNHNIPIPFGFSSLVTNYRTMIFAIEHWKDILRESYDLTYESDLQRLNLNDEMDRLLSVVNKAKEMCDENKITEEVYERVKRKAKLEMRYLDVLMNHEDHLREIYELQYDFVSKTLSQRMLKPLLIRIKNNDEITYKPIFEYNTSDIAATIGIVAKVSRLRIQNLRYGKLIRPDGSTVTFTRANPQKLRIVPEIGSEIQLTFS